MKYSSNLGNISDEQFDKALRRLGLGKFIKAEKVPCGVVGQNVFLTSDKGEFVYRGKPFYPHQFQVEKFMVDNLRSKSNISVAYPYLIDDSTDIFGWTYAIMPRLKGIQIAHGGEIIIKTDKVTRMRIVCAMAHALVEMQKFTWNFAEYHTDKDIISPFIPDYPIHTLNNIKAQLERLPNVSNITKEDQEYIYNTIKKNEKSLYIPFEPCFLMGDFKEDNVLFSNEGTEWKVCGVFDFAMSHFGDGESDLSRIYAMYIDEDTDLALNFIHEYIKLKTPRDGFLERMKIYSLGERLAIWEWAKGGNIAWWDNEISLKDWLHKYINFIDTL